MTDELRKETEICRKPVDDPFCMGDGPFRTTREMVEHMEALHDEIDRLRQQLADLRPGPGNCLLNVERGTLCAVEGFCQLKQGEWIAAADVNRMARELDVAINGEDGVAESPSLCDVVAQAKKLLEQRGEPVAWGVKDNDEPELWAAAVDEHQAAHIAATRGSNLFPLYLAPPARSAVPKGWKLVPVEPTPKMREAAVFGHMTEVDARECYIEMLAAAPSAEEARPTERHKWDESGERCIKCGDKDWMAGPICNGEPQDDGRETWRPIETAPKDGTKILGWCCHAADLYFLPEGNRLTAYGANAEGMSHVEDGPNIVCWRESIDDGECTIPAWWCLADKWGETAANPTHWKPLDVDGPPAAQRGGG